MREEMKWVCVDCNKVLDKTNFVDFIKESDNDKYSNQEAVVPVSPLDISAATILIVVVIIRGGTRNGRRSTWLAQRTYNLRPARLAFSSLYRHFKD